MNIYRLFKQDKKEVIPLKTTNTCEDGKSDLKCYTTAAELQLPTKATISHVTSQNMSMTNSNLKEDNFTFVTNKKKKPKNKLQLESQEIVNPTRYELFDLELTIRRIETAKEDLITTDLYSSLLASLREGLDFLNQIVIEEIVCFGLGKIGECTIARYQLALLLCLRDLYDVKTFVYDPIFNEDDRVILRRLNFNVLSDNTEGKHSIKDQTATLFYLPHCPKQLTNNLLWSNWGLQLSKCLIISNSFTQIIESNTNGEILKNASYIYNLQPHTVELPIINSFKYYEVFNDTAIHVFPTYNIRFIPLEVWENNLEPHYTSKDIEFIRNDESRN